MKKKLLCLPVVAAALIAAPGAAAAYNDSTCRAAAVSWTNDPCAGRQWGHVNIRAPQAWTTTQGAGVTVAVVDTGADFKHPDLATNLISKPGSNLVANQSYRCPGQGTRGNKTSTAVAQDDQGHGTQVSGTVAALTGNGVGVAGVAPAAKVLPVKVLNSNGSGSDADVAAGICFAADNGAKVINLSLGFNPAFSILVQGLGNHTGAAIDYAYSKGAAVLIAAGNEGFPACDFPASHTKALCVGSVDRNDTKSWFSDFGTNVGVVAPGGAGGVFVNDDVWSTIWDGSRYDDGNGYEALAGTSMATPHVAAVAALIAAKYGVSATPSFIYAKLKATSDDLGAPGVDPAYGHGRVNALRAVTE